MKRILTISALLLALLPAVAQVNFIVKGKAHPEAKMLQVGDMSGMTQPETVAVVDGRFEIRGSKPEQTFMVVLDREHRMQSFFIVDGADSPVAIELDMNTDEATGSKLNERLSGLIRQMNTVKSDEEMTALMKQAVDDNKDNVVGAFAFSQLVYVLDYAQLKAYVDSGDAFLQFPICERAKQQVKAMELRAPGTMFKDVVEKDTTGVAHRLSEYVGHGQYVLVDFWASWCGPCMQEMPNVKQNYDKYKGEGFLVVGLSFDRSADAWKRAIREKQLDWIHLSDLKFWQTIAAETYGIHSIPSSILVDPKGTIIAVDLRGPKLGQKLQEIYGF